MDIQHIAMPKAGKDYPRNWNAFLDLFGSEEACLAYLEQLRWPHVGCGAYGPTRATGEIHESYTMHAQRRSGLFDRSEEPRVDVPELERHDPSFVLNVWRSFRSGRCTRFINGRGSRLQIVGRSV
jgi:hypothetical protein